MANGTIAVSSIEMLSQSGTGITTIAPPATNSNFTQTLVPVTGTLAPLVSDTAKASTSGATVDFTGIPSWVKRVTVMFNGVSVSGTSIKAIQIGDSGGIETTGYFGGSWHGASVNQYFSSTTLFPLTVVNNSTAAETMHGNAVFTNISGNFWVLSGAVWTPTYGIGSTFAGSKELSSTLDRIRITTVNGTDTFDAGSINILYE